MDLAREFVRRRARLPLKLPIRVFFRESADYEWTEKSRLVDVNPFGAGFTLARPVEVGRLIHLTIPLPRLLRCFDHCEPMYSVWGLVRHVSVLSKTPPLFRVGVGFLGKSPPASYLEDPSFRYEPLPINGEQSSLWKLRRRSFGNQRREARLIIPLEVLVEALDEHGLPDLQEYTVTETISSLGTCIPSNLNLGVGRLLRISNAIDDISVFGAIRSRTLAANGISRLGVEFISDRWPLQRDSQFTCPKELAESLYP